MRPTENGAVLSLDPHRAELVVDQLGRLAAAAEERGLNPVLAVSPGLRPATRRLVALGVPRLPVLSYSEVGASGLRIETVGTVTLTDALAA